MGRTRAVFDRAVFGLMADRPDRGEKGTAGRGESWEHNRGRCAEARRGSPASDIPIIIIDIRQNFRLVFSQNFH